MFELKVQTHIDSAHFIKNYPGKCAQLHGHRWEIEIAFIGPGLNPLNMLIDFKDIKGLVNNYDHKLLNDELGADCVTAEYLAVVLYNLMGCLIHEKCRPEQGIEVAWVTVWESPECSVTFTGTEDDETG